MWRSLLSADPLSWILSTTLLCRDSWLRMSPPTYRWFAPTPRWKRRVMRYSCGVEVQEFSRDKPCRSQEETKIQSFPRPSGLYNGTFRLRTVTPATFPKNYYLFEVTTTTQNKNDVNKVAFYEHWPVMMIKSWHPKRSSCYVQQIRAKYFTCMYALMA